MYYNEIADAIDSAEYVCVVNGRDTPLHLQEVWSVNSKGSVTLRTTWEGGMSEGHTDDLWEGEYISSYECPFCNKDKYAKAQEWLNANTHIEDQSELANRLQESVHIRYGAALEMAKQFLSNKE